MIPLPGSNCSPTSWQRELLKLWPPHNRIGPTGAASSCSVEPITCKWNPLGLRWSANELGTKWRHSYHHPLPVSLCSSHVVDESSSHLLSVPHGHKHYFSLSLSGRRLLHKDRWWSDGWIINQEKEGRKQQGKKKKSRRGGSQQKRRASDMTDSSAHHSVIPRSSGERKRGGENKRQGTSAEWRERKRRNEGMKPPKKKKHRERVFIPRSSSALSLFLTLHCTSLSLKESPPLCDVTWPLAERGREMKREET